MRDFTVSYLYSTLRSMPGSATLWRGTPLGFSFSYLDARGAGHGLEEIAEDQKTGEETEENWRNERLCERQYEELKEVEDIEEEYWEHYSYYD